MKITAEIEVSESLIADTLASAYEGGSNYWYAGDRTPYLYGKEISKPGKLQLPVKVWENEWEGEATKWTKRKPFTMDKAAIKKGLDVMAAKYPTHFGNMIDENGDAETGDVLLQSIVFGELVYG